MFTKKATKHKDDRIIFGLCAGMADHLRISPTLMRAIWIMVTILTGILPMILVYYYFYHLVPEEKK